MSTAASLPNDPYFHRISLQLIQVPAESATALSRAEQGMPPPPPPKTAFPIDSARSWVSTVLKARFDPPESVAFLAFPHEEGLCDVVRARYRVGDWVVTTAQTRYLLVLDFKGPVQSAPTERERAERTARDIIEAAHPLRFIERGAFLQGTWGEQDVAAAGAVDANWPHWLDCLRWWVDADRLGILTLKAAGGPTRAPIGPIESLNRQWF